MKNILTVFLIAVMTSSCSGSHPVVSSDSTADGKSFETAIVVNETTETKGVDAEYAWIRQHRSGYKVVMQSLSYYKKKNYDVITIKFPDGTEEKIYFDISNFFGHL